MQLEVAINRDRERTKASITRSVAGEDNAAESGAIVREDMASMSIDEEFGGVGYKYL